MNVPKTKQILTRNIFKLDRINIDMNSKIKILIAATLIGSLGEGMLGPLFAVFTQNIGGDILDISGAWALYLFVTGVLTLFIGNISDHGRRKEILVVLGFALGAIFTFSYLLVKSPMHLFIVEAGLGVATAMLTPTWDALYSRHSNKKKTGFAWGIASGGGQIAIAFGIVLGGFVVHFFDFQTLFVIMGILQTIATLIMLRILKK